MPVILPSEAEHEGRADPLDDSARFLDHATGAFLASLTGGLSPASLAAAFQDWASHIAIAPGRQLHLASEAARGWARFGEYLGATMAAGRPVGPCTAPQPHDQRFRDEAWERWPFNAIHQGFLLGEQWWDAATRDIPGVTQHHEDVVRFVGRQLLDVIAPTNFVATNPVVQQRVAQTGGMCLLDGLKRFVEDAQSSLAHSPPPGSDRFRPGIEVAATPGEIVFRNHLFELIRYAPATEEVFPEPILIVPAWIMKYYILDLSPRNSLVRYLVSEGFTVFMISWCNPGIEERDTSFDDYRREGVMAAIDAITAQTGAPKIHAAGYCLGGTLLAIAAATMARDDDQRLATISLLAAQTEFSEPGELGLFIDDAQLAFLDSLMWSQGYLDSEQMGGAFQMLRSNDLVWSRLVHGYLMGESAPINDLMAWNADGTRMPHAMHSQYLRELFLNDDLAEGRYMVEGRSIALEDLRQPLFVVGTEDDHVAPWRSVHKIHLLTEAEITFVLTSGGHNAGIVSEPGHPHRNYRLHIRPAGAPHIDCDNWLRIAELRTGSWWPAWSDWLKQHSGSLAATPSRSAGPSGKPLCAAPGTYVLQR